MELCKEQSRKKQRRKGQSSASQKEVKRRRKRFTEVEKNLIRERIAAGLQRGQLHTLFKELKATGHFQKKLFVSFRNMVYLLKKEMASENQSR